MIYLLGLFIQWVSRALVPALLVLVIGAVVVCLVWRLFLRSNRRAVVVAWLILGFVTVTVGGWRSWEVWQDFNHPERRMFRDYIARPIPNEVTNLTMATPAPAMFHDGALIRFQAPEVLVRGIIDQSLTGSTALEVLAEMKRQSPHDSADLEVIAGTDGQSYRKVTPDLFPKNGPEAHRWLRDKIEATAGPGREIYVLFKAGAWGHFQSVLSYDPANSSVIVQQNLERRRVKRPASGAPIPTSPTPTRNSPP
ncbi:MAG: hypothetical protein H7X97_09315 [Opitutaceae bacterium]|nr:hypothetical protein [Verrucomicrobiales bacterium]